MAITTAERKILEEARRLELDKDLHAVAVKVSLVGDVDPESDAALLEPCVLLEVVPDPVLDILLRATGATPRGRMSWTVGLGEDANVAPLRAVAENVHRGLVWPHGDTHTTRGAKDLHNTPHHSKAVKLENNFRGTPAAGVFYRDTVRGRLDVPQPVNAAGFGAVTVSTDTQGRVAWIRVVTHKLEVPDTLAQITLNQRPAGKSAMPEVSPVLAVDAIPVIEWLAREGVHLRDDDKVIPVLRKRLASSVVALPKPGQPAMAQVAVGKSVRVFVPALEAPEAPAGAAISQTEVSATKVAEALATAPVVRAVLHPGVQDVRMMALAGPFEDESLWDYQRTAVGRHLATKLGYVNACSPGMGKTVMALVPMRVRSKSVEAYRGLVVAEANVRAQWTGEAAKWFPEATVVTITASKDTPKLVEALKSAGKDPLVVITSYAMLNSVVTEMNAREQELNAPAVTTVVEVDGQLGLFGLETVASDEDLARVVAAYTESPAVTAEDLVKTEASLGALLLDTFFHDIIADEAEVLRGTGKWANAMWELRRNCGTAVALTGTPINRGLDDLGRLLSWVRKDERLFRGVKLSEQFELSDPKEQVRFAEAMGPTMFRRDTSEVADDLPTVSSVVMKLRPSAAEKALADAARLELKRVYTELLAAITAAEELDPDNEAFAEARAELTKARGAWLGGTQLARMASSDPASLLGSKSAGAALLTGQGLVAAATQVTGTKRVAVVTDVVERVANGEAVIVFTEFATVASGLIEDLEAAGVKVGAVLGGGGAKRDRMVAEFQRGELDVLVSTSSGERGLNLQRASTIVHYDLPWTPKGVIQRTGRARRLKSENQHITVVFPLMEGTVEEKVASLVVSRAVDSMRALDNSRGVDASATEMGLALGGLAQAVSQTRTGRSGGNNELLQMTEALVS